MSSTARVQIPLRHYQPFSTLLGLSDEQFQALSAALHSARTTFSTKELASAIGTSLAIEPQQANDLVGMLVSLYGLRGEMGISVPEMASELVAALGMARDESLRPTDETRHSVAERLAAALSIDDPLRTIAKGFDLQGEYQHSYVEAHIATDMRPVFQDDLDAPLAAALITHMLQLTYVEGNQEKEFFIALTPSNVDQLKSVLGRAEQKSKSLESVLHAANVLIVGEVE